MQSRDGRCDRLEITTNLYDLAGHQIVAIDPLNYRTTSAYDATGRQILQLNARDYRTTTVYDAAGRQQATINALGNRSTTVYDLVGQKIADINASGQRSTTVYDPAGRAAVQIDRLGRRMTMAYDAAGRKIQAMNPLGYLSTTVYDAAGQSIVMIDPLLNRSTQVYDLAAQVVAKVNGEGERSTTVYDPVGRTIAGINGLGIRVTTLYDAAGRSTDLVDGNAHQTTFVYDAGGRKIREVTPLLTRLTYGYDAVGRKTLRIDPRGVRVSFAYDGNGKQIQVKYPDGSRVTTTYDRVGNRILAQDNTGRYSRVYDPLNRVNVSIQPSGQRLTFLWDAINQRRLMIDVAGGRTTYVHDANGNLSRLVNPQGNITTFSYDVAGQRTQQKLANGTSTTYAFDTAGRTTSVEHYSGAVLIEQLRYRMDGAGRRTVRTNLGGDRTTWTYDAAGQLTAERQTGPTSFSATWTYDPAGNRLSQANGGVSTTYSTDAANRVRYASTVSGRTTYSYDAAGNQTAIEIPAGDITTTIWDADSRQQAVEKPDGSRVTFTYNCDHWRVARQDAFDTTKFVFDKNNLLAELDGSNAVQVQYTNEPNEFGSVISQYRTADAEASYYEFDVQGSTTGLTDSVGVVTDEYQYNAWGESEATTGTTTNPLQYIGQLGYYRDSDLDRYHVRRREYDITLGKFFSEDPRRQDARDDNLYRYVKNDPVNQDDPNGLGGPFDTYDIRRSVKENVKPCDCENLSESELDALSQLHKHRFGRARNDSELESIRQIDCQIRDRANERPLAALGYALLGDSYWTLVLRREELLRKAREINRGTFDANLDNLHRESRIQSRRDTQSVVDLIDAATLVIPLGLAAHEVLAARRTISLEARAIRSSITAVDVEAGTTIRAATPIAGNVEAVGATAKTLPSGTLINVEIPFAGESLALESKGMSSINPKAALKPPCKNVPSIGAAPVEGELLVEVDLKIGSHNGTRVLEPSVDSTCIRPMNYSEFNEAASESVFRTMSEKEYAQVQLNNGLASRPTGSSELGITLSEDYSADLMSRRAKVKKQYVVKVEFEVESGTWETLLNKSATHDSAASLFPDLPPYRKGMNAPQVKVERGGIVSILLGSSEEAIAEFNSRILTIRRVQ